MVVLSVLLLLEFLFRLFVEIREKKLYGKFVPLALFRVIPVLNNFIPFPFGLSKEVLNKDSVFISAHEEAHKKKFHAFFRNFIKCLFFSLMVLMILTQLYKTSLFEIILYSHFALLFFRLFYHRICFSEELEADAFARTKTGLSVAKKSLYHLKIKEQKTSFLFAFLYAEHPPADYRYSKIK